MNYNQLIDYLTTVSEAFKGTLSFDNGTYEKLNAQDDLVYPAMWLLQPVTISLVKNTNGDIILQSYRMNVLFLQKGELASTTNDVELFDETGKIMNGFINKVVSDFDDDTDVLQLGDASQIYRQQDNVNIGWSLPVTIVTSIDNDCCELFD